MHDLLGHEGPALPDFVTISDALEMPSHVREDDARRFALGLGKLVLTGGVDEVFIARLSVRNLPL